MVFMKIISPILLIKIGAIRSERVGHLGLDLELCLLYEKELNKRKGFPKKLNIFYTRNPISNGYLFNLWKEKILILPFPLIFPLDPMVNKLKLLKAHNFFDLVNQFGHSDLALIDRHPPILKIPKDDYSNGMRVLENLGIPPRYPYVCLSVRDSEYLKNYIPQKDWSYHDFRDSNINNYREMSEYLVSKGYAVLRMGKKMKGTLDSSDPLIIDYANSKFKSDFADVFLFSNCNLCISTSTGMDSLATIFRIPLGLVNIVGINSVALGNSVKLFQPKHFFDKTLKRNLTYKEICQRKLFSLSSGTKLHEDKIDLVENSPQELKLFAAEFLDLLNLDAKKQELHIQKNRLVDFAFEENIKLAKLSKNWLKNNPGYLR